MNKSQTKKIVKLINEVGVEDIKVISRDQLEAPFTHVEIKLKDGRYLYLCQYMQLKARFEEPYAEVFGTDGNCDYGFFSRKGIKECLNQDVTGTTV